MRTIIAVSAFLLTLAGCGRESPAENTADRLDRAAAQSDLAAAPSLKEAANEIHDNEDQDDANQAATVAQDALQTGGAAQTGTPPAPR